MYLAVSVLFAPTARPALAMGFIGIVGFHSKLKFADNAITRVLTGSIHVADWEHLAIALRAAADKRNCLAHFHVMEYLTNTPGRRLALSPWSGPKGAPKDKPLPKALCVRDIIKYGYEFNALNWALLNFVHRLMKQPEPFPKDGEQAGDPPTVQQIARQIHEELGHPQQSLRERRQLEDAQNAAASLDIQLPYKEGDDDKKTE